MDIRRCLPASHLSYKARVSPPAVYPEILARDPLASGTATLAPERFVLLNTTFPYEPPYSASDPVSTVAFNISSSSAATTGAEATETYKVGVSLSVGGTFFDLIKAKLVDKATWAWTNKSSTSTVNGESQSATVTVGGPAFGYSGPTLMQVYLDTIYNTFVFVVAPSSLQKAALVGTLVTGAGAPMPNSEVSMIESGRTHVTFTDAKGGFAFYGKMNGSAIVKAPGVTLAIHHLQSTQSIKLHP